MSTFRTLAILAFAAAVLAAAHPALADELGQAVPTANAAGAAGALCAAVLMSLATVLRRGRNDG